LKGAGASFGIITQFTVVTHPAPTVITNYAFQYQISGPEDLANTFIQWQNFITQPQIFNDRNFNSILIVTSDSILIQGSHIGTSDELQASGITAALGDGATITISDLDWAGALVYWATNELMNIAGEIPMSMYIKNIVIPQSSPLTNETAKAWFQYMNDHSPSDVITILTVDLEAGAISDVPQNGTAFAHRDGLYTIAAYALTEPPFPDDAIEYLDGMIQTINSGTYTPPFNGTTTEPFGMYPGYVDPFVPTSQSHNSYWGDNYPRLLEVKAKYDPKNVFRNPQSVGSN